MENDYSARMFNKNIRKAAKIHARALVAAFEESLFYILSSRMRLFYWLLESLGQAVVKRDSEQSQRF